MCGISIKMDKRGTLEPGRSSQRSLHLGPGRRGDAPRRRAGGQGLSEGARRAEWTRLCGRMRAREVLSAPPGSGLHSWNGLSSPFQSRFARVSLPHALLLSLRQWPCCPPPLRFSGSTLGSHSSSGAVCSASLHIPLI